MLNQVNPPCRLRHRRLPRQSPTPQTQTRARIRTAVIAVQALPARRAILHPLGVTALSQVLKLIYNLSCSFLTSMLLAVFTVREENDYIACFRVLKLQLTMHMIIYHCYSHVLPCL